VKIANSIEGSFLQGAVSGRLVMLGTGHLVDILLELNYGVGIFDIKHVYVGLLSSQGLNLPWLTMRTNLANFMRHSPARRTTAKDFQNFILSHSTSNLSFLLVNQAA
jgi:hypothetical protein